MREFKVYDAKDFDMSGNPSEDESFAILKDIHSNKWYYTYIYNDDFEEPTKVDLDSMEEINLPEYSFYEDRVEPIFEHISMRKDGVIVLDSTDKEIYLSERQNRFLVNPYIISTLEGRYVTEQNDGGNVRFYKDMTLEGIRAQKLDYKKTIDAISSIHEDLLLNTHERYGNKFPYFPYGKFFEEENQMIVFITSTQLKEMNDKLLTGKVPFYQNYMLSQNWDINTTYGVCVVDDVNYKARLVKPTSLLKIKNQLLERDQLIQKER